MVIWFFLLSPMTKKEGHTIHFRIILIVNGVLILLNRILPPYISQSLAIFLPKGATSSLPLIPFHCHYYITYTVVISPNFLFPRLASPSLHPFIFDQFPNFCLYHMKSYRIPNNLGFALHWVLISQTCFSKAYHKYSV